MVIYFSDNGPWNLYFPHQCERQTDPPGVDGFPAGQSEASIGLALFNLDEDISETKDLADQYPDIVQKLKVLIDTHLKDLAENSRVPVKISGMN